MFSYISRIKQLETEVDRLRRVEVAALRLHTFATGQYEPVEDETGMTGDDLEREYTESLDALRAALEVDDG